MQALPADTIEVGPLLEELRAHNQVCRFEHAGRPYGAIRNFRKWQRPEKPKVVHPLPDELRGYVRLAVLGAVPSPTESGADEAQSATEDSPAGVMSPTDATRDEPQSATSRRPVAEGSANCSAEVGGNKKERDIFSSTPRKSQRTTEPPEAEFDAFWRAYPRRVGKEDARKAFAKARKVVSLPVLLDAIGRQEWNPDPQFIPHPATWLNKGHWQDELPTATPPSRKAGESYSGCL